MRNLGSRLESWLREHPEHIAGNEQIALDMVRLEWAEIEAFDEAARPRLPKPTCRRSDPIRKFQLQPYIRLLDLNYPVDDLLIQVRSELEETDIVSNAVTERIRSRRGVGGCRNRSAFSSLCIAPTISVYFKRIDHEAFTILSRSSRWQDAFRRRR